MNNNEGKEEENLGRIPYQAIYHEPQEKEIIDELLGMQTRRIFEIPIEEYTEYEKEKLIEFYEFLKQNNYKIPNKNKSGKYYYANIVRQLQGTNFDYQKCYEEIINEILFKNEKLPIEINDDVKNVLNSGFLYVHGRDNCFRPCIIFNPGLFTSIACSFENWEKFGVYFFESLINKYLLPSKFESWNMIVDLGDLKMTNIPYQLKDIFSPFIGVYRCRLYKLYLLNMNYVFTIAWNIAKMIIGPIVEAKACKVDTNDGTYDLLFNSINRNQIEKKYGGNAENLKEGQYYPPKFENEHYFCGNKEEEEKEDLNNIKIDSYKDSDSNLIFYEAKSE